MTWDYFPVFWCNMTLAQWGVTRQWSDQIFAEIWFLFPVFVWFLLVIMFSARIFIWIVLTPSLVSSFIFGPPLVDDKSRSIGFNLTGVTGEPISVWQNHTRGMFRITTLQRVADRYLRAYCQRLCRGCLRGHHRDLCNCNNQGQFMRSTPYSIQFKSFKAHWMGRSWCLGSL